MSAGLAYRYTISESCVCCDTVSCACFAFPPAVGIPTDSRGEITVVTDGWHRYG